MKWPPADDRDDLTAYDDTTLLPDHDLSGGDTIELDLDQMVESTERGLIEGGRY